MRRANLKQIIRRKKILASGVVEKPFTMPGEPMIYSLKYSVGARLNCLNVFRNMQWKSMLKCFFCSQYKTSTPVVLIARFYCSPPSHVTVDRASLVCEKIPATHCHEICDYVLSFIEMLHHVLINSYRQIVKLDVEKYYSAKPRTVFQFMRWDDYEELHNPHSFNSESKRFCAPRQGGDLQPERAGDARDEKIRTTEPGGRKTASLQGASSCHSSVPHPSTTQSAGEKKKTAKLPSACKKA